ncbi:MAG: 50S ribosomal protein L22 [Bacilli bacterium]|nr:50S ribosomal protein L22 [Bacilli bacterium]
MESYAIAKMQRISPIKARLVIDLIRGKNVNDAKTILVNYNTKASKLILNVLNSATANAVNNEGADESKLFVSEARVDAGPVMKRIMFDSRGYIGHKDKRTSHIVVRVKER